MKKNVLFIIVVITISFIYCNQKLVLNQSWFDGTPKITEIDLGENIFEVSYYIKSGTYWQYVTGNWSLFGAIFDNVEFIIN